ncbi:MAG: CotH kinase family protein [Solobacterium sp.]|nr:CotH kinase family protein [Solobacterium sp.]
MNTLILALLAAHVIPVIITELILCSCPFLSRKGKRITTGISPVIHAVFFLVVMTLLFQANPITKIGDFVSLNCSYQDLAGLGLSNLICLLVPLLVWFSFRRYIRLRGGSAEPFHKKGMVLLLCCVSFFLAFSAWVMSMEGVRSIRLSGFSRKMTLSDEEEEELSYVTIRNEGVLANETKDLYVSDHEEDLLYCRLEEGTIRPGESLTTYITADDGMNIRKNGGSSLWLSTADGRMIDHIILPRLQNEEAYVKTGDEWSVVSLVKEQVSLSAPEFSAESGFYESAFDLSLSAEKGMKIYYTLDCTDPTAESIPYTGPIHVYDKSSEANRFRSVQNVEKDYLETESVDPGPVDKAFIVRAVAVDENGNASSPVTRSYFINLGKYRDRKVVSLVTDPANLFDPETGIYVTGAEYDEWYRQVREGTISPDREDSSYQEEPTCNFSSGGDEWERKADCELIDDSVILIRQPVGIRIQGDSSTYEPLKRFSVYSRRKYGTDTFFDQPIFPGIKTHAFVLRNGFLNAFTPTLTEDRSVSVQKSVPVSVFLDGEFWYDTYLQEKYIRAYFSEHYGINRNNVVREAHLENTDLMEAIGEIDASSGEGYDRINEIMDIQSYIDFTCINAYLDNEDTHDNKNVVMWRCAIREGDGYEDGRWRWGLFDQDLLWNFSMRDHTGGEPAYAVNTFTLPMASERSELFAITDQELFNKLKPNRTFQKQFVLTFMDLVNTDFRPDAVIPKLEAFEDWGEANEEQYEFFQKRADYIVPYMAEEFGLTGTLEPLTLTSNRPECDITLNTITPDLENGSWLGQYYTDVPVMVSCEDSSFDHWEIITGDNAEIRTEPSLEVPVSEGGTHIHAVFR